MTHSLRSRVERLERASPSGRGELRVISLHDDESEDAALSAEGVTAGPHDTVVFLRVFGLARGSSVASG